MSFDLCSLFSVLYIVDGVHEVIEVEGVGVEVRHEALLVGQVDIVGCHQGDGGALHDGLASGGVEGVEGALGQRGGTAVDSEQLI